MRAGVGPQAYGRQVGIEAQRRRFVDQGAYAGFALRRLFDSLNRLSRANGTQIMWN